MVKQWQHGEASDLEQSSQPEPDVCWYCRYLYIDVSKQESFAKHRLFPDVFCLLGGMLVGMPFDKTLQKQYVRQCLAAACDFGLRRTTLESSWADGSVCRAQTIWTSGCPDHRNPLPCSHQVRFNLLSPTWTVSPWQWILRVFKQTQRPKAL